MATPRKLVPPTTPFIFLNYTPSLTILAPDAYKELRSHCFIEPTFLYKMSSALPPIATAGADVKLDIRGIRRGVFCLVHHSSPSPNTGPDPRDTKQTLVYLQVSAKAQCHAPSKNPK